MKKELSIKLVAITIAFIIGFIIGIVKGTTIVSVAPSSGNYTINIAN